MDGRSDVEVHGETKRREMARRSLKPPNPSEEPIVSKKLIALLIGLIVLPLDWASNYSKKGWNGLFPKRARAVTVL